MEIFKQKIISSVDRSGNGTHDLMDDQSANTIHNVAFYPVCEFNIENLKINFDFFIPKFRCDSILLGSMNNETSWLAENTAKLYFSTHLLAKLEPNTFLHNAKLR